MTDVLATPVFGVLISLLAFEIGLWLNRKTQLSLLNPLLIAVALVILLIQLTPLTLEDYNRGGQIISFLLAPATVALAIPLYKSIRLLKESPGPILAGVVAGSLLSLLSIIFLSKLFHLSQELLLSMMPKSVTTPIGIALSEQLGGLPQVTVAAIVVTGIFGAVLAQPLFRILKITDPVAQGIAIGTASHVLGTAKALEIGETEGAMSGLSISLAGLATVLMAPILSSWLV
ncbi:MAG: LrgB family protein [Eubacteriales bacterium]|nr:LrgB family protein [Eubacteriales bacterium]